jgi:hypothetical protein
MSVVPAGTITAPFVGVIAQAASAPKKNTDISSKKGNIHVHVVPWGITIMYGSN